MTIGAPLAAVGIATASAVFVGLLIVASLLVGVMSKEWINPVRMVGGAVRRWGGVVLVAVGLWFLILAAIDSPPFL